MERTLSELDTVYALINLEWEKYRQAIRGNQKFEDVKVIYLTIKELERKADQLMQQAHTKIANLAQN
jgi:hypothetical protein